MTAYYNDFDPQVCDWLEELIRRGHIAQGVVDRRSILDVAPADLRGFTQCHFFAGVGGWSYALRLAGWQDSWPVWTGSPPCQPFSAAGRQLGQNDERHLAPHFAELIAACRPPILFGEQVASSAVFGKAAGNAKRPRDGHAALAEWCWLDDLSDRLERAHYAVGASDIPAAGVGAPHIRQRTFFGAIRLADTHDAGPQGRVPRGSDQGRESLDGHLGCGGAAIGLADPNCTGPYAGAQRRVHRGEEGPGAWNVEPERSGYSGGMANAFGVRQFEGRGGGAAQERNGPAGDSIAASVDLGSGPLNQFWADADWLFCRDGKWRPVEPSVLGLANGVPPELVRSGAFVPACYPIAKPQKADARRVMRLRGYGNAIVPQSAAHFIQIFTQATGALI